MSKVVFRQWNVDQGGLFPPAFRDLVPEDHLVHFLRRIVAESLDLSTIAEFGKRHSEGLSALLVQVLALYHDAGMVKLGHVALDGTKSKARLSRAVSRRR